MRIVIASPPKTGNVWLKCLLAAIYDLRALGPKLSPELPRFDSFQKWVADGKFSDDTVYHQHYDYSPELADAISAIPAHIVSIVRDPYDAFVSSFFTLQQHADVDNTVGHRKPRSATVLIGKPLDHPDVYSWLEDGGFQHNLIKGKEWLESGRAFVLRYEALLGDPVTELIGLTDRILPVARENIEQAVEACSADAMRKNAKRAKHVRAAKVGDSKGRLTKRHLEIFQKQSADLIRALGYEVRDPESAPAASGESRDAVLAGAARVTTSGRAAGRAP